MKDFFKLLNVAKENRDKTFAMATVIHVEGSSYRKEGAKMLVGLDGSTVGTISAGCLEEDLKYRALDVLDSNCSKIITYDLMAEDDYGWGQGAGCNGRITVFIEPFYWAFIPPMYKKPIYPLIHQYMDSKEKVVSIKRLDDNKPLDFLSFYSEGRGLIGEASDHFLPELLKSRLEDFLKKGAKFETVCLGHNENEFLFELCEPKDILFVFGAGPDAEPLVEIAARMDYEVTVVDPRGSRCCRSFFPSADTLVVEHPKMYLKETELPPHSYAIIMTHNFHRDQEILKHLIHSPLRYLGVLGPRKRTERLMSGEHVSEQIYSPVGLNIGAEGSEEISVSIMAELIKVRNDRTTPAIYSSKLLNHL
jgi:xanthine dehydrogenase accessory factor